MYAKIIVRYNLLRKNEGNPFQMTAQQQPNS